MRWITLVLGAALAATYASPAVGGPDLAGRVRRVDQREAAHYASIDRRLKATVLLTLSQRVLTTAVTGPMIQSTDGRFFRGSASCYTGHALVGGGVDWGTSTVYGDYHVIASAPDTAGLSWQAAVTTGSAPVPTASPTVYAVCADVN